MIAEPAHGLDLEAVTVDIGGHRLLGGISFSIAGGQLVALVGPNGAGKTTLLRAITGLVASGGTVRIDRTPLTGLNLRARARLMSYLPQNGSIAWAMRVRDVVAIGRLPHEGRRQGAEEARIVEEAMEACGVLHLADMTPERLSGGERVRVMLARALAVEAPILLLDEPVASLDPARQLAVMDLLRQQARAGRIVVVVLHDLALALRYASRALVMCDGLIHADGTPAELLANGALGTAFDLTLDSIPTVDGFSVHARRIAEPPAAAPPLPVGSVGDKTK